MIDIFKRRINLYKFVSFFDSDGDGVDDTLGLKNSNFFIYFLLKQNYKDLGVYTDYNEDVEIIELSGLWDLTNDGTLDIGVVNPNIVIPSASTNTVDISTDSLTLAIGCTDPQALNYNPNAVIPCVNFSCCQYAGQEIGSVSQTSDNTTPPSQASNQICDELIYEYQNNQPIDFPDFYNPNIGTNIIFGIYPSASYLAAWRFTPQLNFPLDVSYFSDTPVIETNVNIPTTELFDFSPQPINHNITSYSSTNPFVYGIPENGTNGIPILYKLTTDTNQNVFLTGGFARAYEVAKNKCISLGYTDVLTPFTNNELNMNNLVFLDNNLPWHRYGIKQNTNGLERCVPTSTVINGVNGVRVKCGFCFYCTN
jgi:hypothetical protein